MVGAPPGAGAAANLESVAIVSNGTTRTGLLSLQRGEVNALTYKSPQTDGALPVHFAVDWLRGLEVPRAKALPVHIITCEEAVGFLNREDFQNVDLGPLKDAIAERNPAAVDRFMRVVVSELLRTKIVSIESFRGFLVQIVSYLMGISKEQNLNFMRTVGDYETLYRNLFNRQSIEQTLAWITGIAKNIIDSLSNQSCTARVERALRWVEENYMQPLSLRGLADNLGMSSRYLGHLFRKQAGHQFNEFLNEVRLEKAAALLEHSSLNTREISECVGYRGANYFYRLFRTRYGVSPSAYRRAARQESVRRGLEHRAKTIRISRPAS